MANMISRAVTGVQDWVNERAPGMMPAYRKHMSEYYAPKNFNFWYYFGSLAMLVLVNQIVTGIFLTMHFKPSAAEAFASVEYIMRDVDGGWLIRYMHSTGASLFFVVVYLHMFRGLIYGSYQKPRELVWILGMFIFLSLMAEAFFGYVLPWGQMSYWGAQVIINLFGAIPWVGEALTEWIRGDYLVSDATLNRFFALHVIALPLVILLLVVLHLGALHEVGSNNPDGVDIKKVKNKETGIPKDGIAFHPYYTVKDLFGVGFFLTIAAFILFFAPEFGGLFLEHDNFVMADPMVTPEHIKPVWYFTPYYAMLRAIPDKLMGVMVMGGATLILFGLPWFDRSPVKSIRYRPFLHKAMIALFCVAFVVLGWLGMQAGSTTQTWVARGLTFYYFAFFLSMPIWSRMGTFKAVPERVTTHD
ncbi:MAG: cytochrome bc complex cytochrome b subunit [Chiayiivirga sp.]|jgi:ubiquinol-cytochrome c reductase cytochrome b subunit|uniref:cytochrome b n=1 Tax=Chiayiivirga sp. TaxID=2041042 RepID=UPI0025B9B79A|nr:cytochrome bc complex cytochrome b subunit [Chiayiivirga sp.]MCI1709282.1 cytochrome bc complex cytochrome b subunit [Chiayiivirga sp.]MCI1730680.1 cytochrome bc complex cytochrome b subunit [Chiayiivirga sp.]